MIDIADGPAFRQVARELRGQIASGELPAGSRLPSMADLRESYGVSNTVIRDALNELRRDGLIVGRQGVGVFVQASAATQASRDVDVTEQVQSLTEMVTDLQSRVSALEDHVRATKPRE